MCIGAEHQGSNFHAKQAAALGANRVRSLHAQMKELRDDLDNGNKTEVMEQTGR